MNLVVVESEIEISVQLVIRYYAGSVSPPASPVVSARLINTK
jgi:hypothetical protein